MPVPEASIRVPTGRASAKVPIWLQMHSLRLRLIKQLRKYAILARTAQFLPGAFFSQKCN